jgi:hypothetical protein
MADFSGHAPARRRDSVHLVKTIELTDEELRLVVAAVHSYLDDFGHEEADLLRRLKELLRKLEATPAA